MKNLLFIALFLGFNAGLFAQLSPGSKLPGNITGTDELTGVDIDVQAWLDEGKTVVIDVFATWCGPCWSFHKTGWLDNYNELYGPEGTDQIRVLGIEGDASTSVSELTASALGDWTVSPSDGEQITYNLLNNSAAYSTLGLTYYPSLIMIKPDGTMVELFTLEPNPRFNNEFWRGALEVDSNVKAYFIPNMPLGGFCDQVSFPGQSMEFLNTSGETITSAVFNVEADGQLLEAIPYSGPAIPPFTYGTITLSDQTFNEEAEVAVILAEVNGQAGPYNRIRSLAQELVLTTTDMTILFTSDEYPSETSWSVEDQNGNLLFTSPAYSDASHGNQSISYPLTINSDVTCLKLSMSDSWGDGMGYFSPAFHPLPGLEILDANGEQVKDNKIVTNGTQIDYVTGESVWPFGTGNSAISFEINVNLTTNTDDIKELKTFSVFPNPVMESLNVVLDFTKEIDYNISVIDAYGRSVSDLGNHSNNGLTKNFDISDLSSGMYFLSISSDHGQNMTKFTKI